MQDLSQVYSELSPKIYRFIFYRIRHKETAEDLTSQTFLKVASNFNKFNPEKGSITSWVYKIAQNTLTDHFRRNRITMDIEKVFDLTDKQDVEKEASDNISVAKIREALKILSPEQQEIVIMRLWDDLPYSEIASITKKSEAGCRVIFSRAIAKLKKHTLAIATLIFLTLTTWLI